MSRILRTLSFGLLAVIGLGASAQGHTIFVFGHANPCNPAMAGSTVNIHVQGNVSGGVSATATLNENCYYYTQLLVPDTAGWVAVSGSCGNGSSTVDTTFYSLTPPFTNDVLVDLSCGNTPPSCDACFTVAQNSVFTGRFTSCSSGAAPITYLWDFSGPGGGAVSGDNISHTFPGPGQYAACLNLTDASNCTSSVCHTIYVDSLGNVGLTPPESCQACFTISQASSGGQLTPFVADFTNCTSGTGPFAFSWWLPNGSTSNGTNESFTFNGPGIYGVCLTSTDPNACTSTFCDTLVVDANGGIGTTPLWYDCLGVLWGNSTMGTPCSNPATGQTGTWSMNCECVPNSVTFDCLQIPNGPNMPGTPCQQNGISGTWSANCTCVPNSVTFDCLQVPNGPNMPGTPCQQNGISGTWSANCTCVPNTTGDCEASFWIMQAYENGDTTGTGTPIPNTLWVWNLSNGGTGLYQFLWNFGDSTYSELPFPTHTYAGSGPYILCLTVTDSGGCTDTYCDSLYVDDDGLYNGIIGEGGHRSTLTINVVNPLTMAVDEHHAPGALSIWPNPAREQLNIAFTNGSGGTAYIEVVDLNGRVAIARQERIAAGGNRILLNTEALPAGLYALRIGNGTHTIIQRFVRD